MFSRGSDGSAVFVLRVVTSVKYLNTSSTARSCTVLFHGVCVQFESDLLKVDLGLTPGHTCRIYDITTSLEPIGAQYDTKLNITNTEAGLNCDAGDEHIIT